MVPILALQADPVMSFRIIIIVLLASLSPFLVLPQEFLQLLTGKSTATVPTAVLVATQNYPVAFTVSIIRHAQPTAQRWPLTFLKLRQVGYAKYVSL